MAYTFKRKQKARIQLIAILVGLAAVVGVACLLIFGGIPDQKNMVVVFDSGLISHDVSINGVDVSNMTPKQARVAIDEQVRAKAESLAIKLKYSDRTDTLDAEKIGVYPNADAIIQQAMLLGRSGGIQERKQGGDEEANRAFELGYTYDESQLEANIRAAAEELNTEPIEPKVESISGKEFTFVDGKSGVDLDVDEFVNRVATVVKDGTFATVEVPGTVKEPTYTLDEIRQNTVKISSTTTYFKDALTSGRVFNIKKICGLLSGSVVMPGEEFSVNKTAGDRTLANGWQLANGYENGTTTLQAGGGICQASSTLYGSLLKADLQITERRPHSIPVSYLDRALDAAISTGGPDLKFKNNTDWPIYIIMYVDDKEKSVTAEVYGRPLEDGMTIKLESVSVTNEPYDPTPIYVTDPDQVRKGRNKYVDEAWKVYYDKNGKEIKRVKANTSTYRSSQAHVLDPALTATPTPQPTPQPAE